MTTLNNTVKKEKPLKWYAVDVDGYANHFLTCAISKTQAKKNIAEDMDLSESSVRWGVTATELNLFMKRHG
jgi:hypothetical protein